MSISEVFQTVADMGIPAQKTAPKSGFDLLTVQKLFSSLELDCDEQIKQLDECEMRRKALELKQQLILNEIKSKWQQEPYLFKFRRLSSISLRTYQDKRNKPKAKSSKLQERSIKKKYKSHQKCYVYLFSRHINTIKVLQYFQRKHPDRSCHSRSNFALILTQKRPSSSFCIPVRTRQTMLFKITKEKNKVSLEFFYQTNGSNVKECYESFEYLINEWNVKQKLKRSVVKTQLAKPVNYQTLEKKLNDNLLDLYYEKYCHPLPVTVMRNKSAPVKSPLLEDKRKVRFFKSYHRGQHC